METAVICEPVRTAVGGYGGSLRPVQAHELGAAVVRGLLDRTGLTSADVDLLDGLTASGEVRNTHDQQNLDLIRNDLISNTVEPYGRVGGISSAFTNYRASLKYKFTPNAMVYGSVATGTKAGGYNGRATLASELSYKPEDNTTFELGAKLSFLDSKLVVDAAVYHIKTSNLQINGVSADPNNVGQVVKNFGGTRNTGFEFSTTYEPLRKLVFGVGFAYTDPKYSNGTNDVSGAATCAAVASCAARVTTVTTAQGPTKTVDLDGTQIEFSSKVTLNLTADYRHAIFAEYEGFVHADYRYESKQYVGLEDLYYVGSRRLLNLRAGVGQGPYTVAVFLRNALNDRTPVYPTQATELNNFSMEFLANLPEPETFGVEFGYHF